MKERKAKAETIFDFFRWKKEFAWESINIDESRALSAKKKRLHNMRLFFCRRAANFKWLFSPEREPHIVDWWRLSWRERDTVKKRRIECGSKEMFFRRFFSVYFHRLKQQNGQRLQSVVRTASRQCPFPFLRVGRFRFGPQKQCQ